MRALFALGLLSLCACSAAPRKQTISPPGAVRLAAYSSAVRSGSLVFLSGAVGNRPGTRELVPGGVAEETRQALANVRATLQSAGLEVADLVKCTVFLADIAEYDTVNAAYAAFFTADPPARSAVGVSGLPLGARVEIECIAAAR